MSDNLTWRPLLSNLVEASAEVGDLAERLHYVYYVAFNHPNCRKTGMVRKFREMMAFVKGMIDKA